MKSARSGRPPRAGRGLHVHLAVPQIHLGRRSGNRTTVPTPALFADPWKLTCRPDHTRARGQLLGEALTEGRIERGYCAARRPNVGTPVEGGIELMVQFGRGCEGGGCLVAFLLRTPHLYGHGDRAQRTQLVAFHDSHISGYPIVKSCEGCQLTAAFLMSIIFSVYSELRRR
jgi:hypothetical protein